MQIEHLLGKCFLFSYMKLLCNTACSSACLMLDFGTLWKNIQVSYFPVTISGINHHTIKQSSIMLQTR